MAGRFAKWRKPCTRSPEAAMRLSVINRVCYLLSSMERIFCSKFTQAYGFVGHDIFWVLPRNVGQQCPDILRAVGIDKNIGAD